MKKWMYVISVGAMLAIFLVMYFSEANKVEERERVTAAKIAEQQRLPGALPGQSAIVHISGQVIDQGGPAEHAASGSVHDQPVEVKQVAAAARGDREIVGEHLARPVAAQLLCQAGCQPLERRRSFGRRHVRALQATRPRGRRASATLRRGRAAVTTVKPGRQSAA